VELVIDANIVLKWFIVEDDSKAALALRVEHNFSAPDLLLIECRNALINKVRRGTLSPDEARHVESQFDALGIDIIPSISLLPNAFQLALDLGETIYDCIYLAAAVATERLLVSADARFAAKVAASSIAQGRVRLLSAVGP
jgi:predicted nucleic acid-binding protein